MLGSQDCGIILVPRPDPTANPCYMQKIEICSFSSVGLQRCTPSIPFPQGCNGHLTSLHIRLYLSFSRCFTDVLAMLQGKTNKEQ